MPGIDEAAILLGETGAFSHYLYVMGKDISFDNETVDLLFNLRLIAIPIITYLGLRTVKVYGYIFEK